MVDFAVTMYLAQCKAGRTCVFEHPATATLWQLPSLLRLAEICGMRMLTFDMCRFGMKVRNPDSTEGLARKKDKSLH